MEVYANTTTFTRIGVRTLEGGARGTVPFTAAVSRGSDTLNRANSIRIDADLLSAFPSYRHNITQRLQGSSTEVLCEWSNDSPLLTTSTASTESQSSHIYNTIVSCGDTAPAVTIAGTAYAIAGICLVTESQQRRRNLYVNFGDKV